MKSFLKLNLFYNGLTRKKQHDQTVEDISKIFENFGYEISLIDKQNEKKTLIIFSQG